jgi:hypothetical protein
VIAPSSRITANSTTDQNQELTPFRPLTLLTDAFTLFQSRPPSAILINGLAIFLGDV